MKLRDIAHSRAGDKGNQVNLSLIPYDAAHYEYLCQTVTAARVAAHLRGCVRGTVQRFELPAIAALNFVLDDALGGGVTRSLALDAHGKTLSSALLELDIPAPPGFVTAPLCTPTRHLPRAQDFLLWPPSIQPYGYRIVDQLFHCRTVPRGTTVRPLQYGAPLACNYHCASGTFSSDEVMDRNALSGILVIKNGCVVIERYGLGLQADERWSTMSTIKSITATLVGVALHEGAIATLDDVVTRYVPSLAGSAYEAVTIRHLLTMSSGVAWNEDYTDRHSDVNRYSQSLADGVPDGVLALLKTLPRAHPPGVTWHYNSGDTFLLGAALRQAVGMPLAQFLATRIWQPCGMEFDAFYTLESPDGLEIGGSRAGMTLRDLGRFAQFILDDGVVDGKRVLPPGWMDDASQPAFVLSADDLAHNRNAVSARLHGYGYSWWLGEDGAINAMGFAGQRIHIDRAQALAIITLGAFPQPPYQGPGDHDRVAEVTDFINAVKDHAKNNASTVPNS